MDKTANFASLEKLLRDLIPLVDPDMQERLGLHIAFVRWLRAMSGPPQRTPGDGITV